jgi:putative transposase
LEIIERNPGYGYRRLKAELKNRGLTVNHKRLLLLLSVWGLTLRRKLRKHVRSGIDTILQFLGSRVLAIKRLPDDEINTLGKVIFTDFTEIVYNNGLNKIYLIPYLENMTKKVIGYAIGRNQTTDLALISLNQAIKTLTSWKVDISKSYFHQDQGSVFKSYDYVGAIVKVAKAFISYSRVGKPQDNPEMESFFGRFKDDWRHVFYQAQTEDEIIRLISNAITYYNTERIHSNHKNKSPDEFLKSIIKN